MGREEPAGQGWSFAGDLTRVYWDRFDSITGLRAAFFSLVPLVIGIATNQLNAGVISSIGALNEGVVSTLGALNLSFVEGPAPSRTRLAAILLTGCVANAVAFSLGTLVGTTGTVLAVPLVAVGVFALMAIRVVSGMDAVGVVASVVFTVGVGLPGGNVAAAGDRFWLMLAGGAWAILGALLQLWLRRATRTPPGVGAALPPPASRAEVLLHSLVVAVTVAVGLGSAETAGLVRDYWVMLTVVMSLRPRPAQTVSYTAARVAGTAGGAIVALVVTLATSDPVISLILMAIFAFAMFSTRNVSLVIFTFFLTAFIIILLNLAFSGGSALAIARMIDVGLGGALALLASAVMWLPGRMRR